MSKKFILAKGHWNPKRKMWVATHFSERIKQPHSKKALKYKECMAISFQMQA